MTAITNYSASYTLWEQLKIAKTKVFDRPPSETTPPGALLKEIEHEFQPLKIDDDLFLISVTKSKFHKIKKVSYSVKILKNVLEFFPLMDEVDMLYQKFLGKKATSMKK